MCTSTINRFGATPASIQWKVVRGDTAQLSVDFLELDETTGFDCDGWTYEATTYDSAGDVLDQLIVESEGNSVTIIAPASLTLNWGSGYKNVVSELPFDLQVNIPAVGENTIWTPIIGTITVLGDVTPGGSL
jgi:hypothetical protein